MTTRRDDDFAEEIEAHLALEAERLIEDGVAPDEARDQARRAFGNVTRARERYYEARRIAWVEDLGRDLRSAVRNVRRNPVSAAIVVLSLAGGIGAATTALIVRNVIFHNPPPLYVAPEELVQVQAAPRERPIFPAGNDVPVALSSAGARMSAPASPAPWVRGPETCNTPAASTRWQSARRRPTCTTCSAYSRLPAGSSFPRDSRD